jgi:hypothetical protein
LGLAGDPMTGIRVMFAALIVVMKPGQKAREPIVK